MLAIHFYMRRPWVQCWAYWYDIKCHILMWDLRPALENSQNGLTKGFACRRDEHGIVSNLNAMLNEFTAIILINKTTKQTSILIHLQYLPCLNFNTTVTWIHILISNTFREHQTFSLQGYQCLFPLHYLLSTQGHKFQTCIFKKKKKKKKWEKNLLHLKNKIRKRLNKWEIL